MTKRRQAALVATATRGIGHEQQVAREKIKTTALAVRSEEQDDVWTGQGVLARQRNGNKAYLRGAALKHFLSHVRDGQAFTVRSVPMSEDFGTGDFYMVLSWLLKHGLCLKNGTKYTVVNRNSVRSAWNQAVDQMKL
jgi:hypothetical protein